MGEQAHWETVYRAKSPDQVSWYTPHLDRSLGFIAGAALPLDAAIIDVGGGAATLVDDLLDRGFSDVTVLDLASAAIERAKERLGARAARVRWVVGDVTESASLGSAVLAAVGAGLHRNVPAAVAAMVRTHVVEPEAGRIACLDARYAKWREIYGTLRTWTL